MNPGRKKVLIAVGSPKVMDKKPANRYQALTLLEPLPYSTHYLNIALFITS
jgi:hypothetical protein